MQRDDEKILYQGKIVEVVELYRRIGTACVTMEIARRAPGVRVIIKTKDGKFILNKEKRHELAGEEDLRLPGGKVFDTLNEYHEFLETYPGKQKFLAKAKESAIRESKEEV